MPLGNYHNMTPRGGIGPEFVAPGDFDHMLLLLEYLATHPPRPGLVPLRRAELDAIFERLGPRLRSA